jgi:hypothetical protein
MEGDNLKRREKEKEEKEHQSEQKKLDERLA